VTLKIRFADFRTITRSATEKTPLASGSAIARLAKRLLAQVDAGPGIRLLGVSLSNLVEGSQLSLEEDDKGVRPAIDEVRRRFGMGAIGPAALADKGRLGVLRRGDQQWGPGREGPPGKSDGMVGEVKSPGREREG
jgi:DNA polymerase IV